MSIEFYLGFLVFVLVIGIAVAIHFLLRTKKALFSKNQMFDSTGELMFILDRNGCVQEVNSIVIELLGMDREEVLNLNFTTFLDFNQEVVTDELLQKFSVKHFMEQFSFVDKIVSLDIHLLNKIHHRLPVLLSGKKIYSLEGELDGYVISARDMRFQKEKQMQVIQTSKMTSIHALTAGVAHEINNPLMILRGNVEILKMCLPDAVAKNEKIVKILNKQFSAVERIVRIVSGLRDYSRPRNDTVHVFDANKIIENSLDIFSDSYRESGVIIRPKFTDKSIPLLGESVKFSQLISNLLSNAVDAVANVENPVVTIETEVFEDMGVLRISDNGMGIQDENLIKIFDMFYTTKAGKGGVGMGLGIINRYVTEMDGHIYLKSKVGKGTSFYLEFPLVKKGEQKNQVTGQISFQPLKGKVLLVDDEQNILDIVAMHLTELGFDVDTVTCPVKALELVKTNAYDYVLADYLMPTMRGDELLDRIVKIENIVTPKLLIITGVLEFKRLVKEDDRNDIYKHVEHVILKPCSKSDLYKAFRVVDEPKATVKKSA